MRVNKLRQKLALKRTRKKPMKPLRKLTTFFGPRLKLIFGERKKELESGTLLTCFGVSDSFSDSFNKGVVSAETLTLLAFK